VERSTRRPCSRVASPDCRGRTTSFHPASGSPVHVRPSSDDPFVRRQRALSSVGARRVHADVGGCDGSERRASCDVRALVAWTCGGVLTVASCASTRAADVFPEGGSRREYATSTGPHTFTPRIAWQTSTSYGSCRRRHQRHGLSRRRRRRHQRT
jgi:hypothetical protein